MKHIQLLDPEFVLAFITHLEYIQLWDAPTAQCCQRWVKQSNTMKAYGIKIILHAQYSSTLSITNGSNTPPKTHGTWTSLCDVPLGFFSLPSQIAAATRDPRNCTSSSFSVSKPWSAATKRKLVHKSDLVNPEDCEARNKGWHLQWLQSLVLNVPHGVPCIYREVSNPFQSQET